MSKYPEWFLEKESEHLQVNLETQPHPDCDQCMLNKAFKEVWDKSNGYKEALEYYAGVKNYEYHEGNKAMVIKEAELGGVAKEALTKEE